MTVSLPGVLRKTAASSPMPATSECPDSPGALPQGIDEIEFAFGGTVVVGTLFLFVSHP